MGVPPVSDEDCARAADALRTHGGNQAAAAAECGVPRTTFQNWIKRASAKGLLGWQAVLPGYVAKVISTQSGPAGDLERTWVKQSPEPAGQFNLPEGHSIRGVSALLDGSGSVLQQWVKTSEAVDGAIAAIRTVADELKQALPHIEPTKGPSHCNGLLLNQFTVTDLHFGMLSWREETGADYDLKIAEQLLLDWFAAAIEMAPNAQTAILAQLGDLLHHDSHLSVTPTHAHVLDADSRLQKIIRIVIRTMRRVIAMLLAKHERVHVIMADANHDPAGGAWLREMFASIFEDEPRVTVDSSASTYYVYEHGETSLFYHHGHRRKIGNVDSVFAGQFREAYGRTKYSYAHIGHLHSDELKSTNLMKVERHETLAAADAFAANGGWLAGRSAKVITYHKQFGEVSRCIISPQMLVSIT